MRDVIEQKVMELLRGAATEAAGDVSLGQTLGELSIDSMKLIEIVFQLEEAFGFEADEGELAAISTVRNLVDVVHASVDAKQGTRAAAAAG